MAAYTQPLQRLVLLRYLDSMPRVYQSMLYWAFTIYPRSRAKKQNEAKYPIPTCRFTAPLTLS